MQVTLTLAGQDPGIFFELLLYRRYFGKASTQLKAPALILNPTEEVIVQKIGWIWLQNGSVSWRRRAQVKQLAWPMAEWQIEHRKSSLVLSTRFPVVKWGSRSSVCNTTQANWNRQLCLLNKLVLLSDYPIRICGCQFPKRWTRRGYYSRRSLPSLLNPLSFFPTSFFYFWPPPHAPPPSPLTPATQATTTYNNSCRKIKRLKAFLSPRGFRPEGEIPRGHSSNSRVY